MILKKISINLGIEMGKVVPVQDQNFFLTGTGTGTKNDWSRSCLLRNDHVAIGVIHDFVLG